MNKEKKEKSVIAENDVANNKNEDVYIEEMLKEWDGSAYGSLKWDKEKQKWVRAKFQ